MKEKIKILWHSDSSVSTNSGFGKVSLELLTRLSRNSKYEIAELGIGNQLGTNYKVEPTWKIYLSGRMQHCEDNFVDVVKDFRPDVVISLLDAHMSCFINDVNQVPLEVRNSFKAISHIPIDGGPVDDWGLKVLAGWNYLVPIHPYGYETLQSGYLNLIDIIRKECLELITAKVSCKDVETIEEIDRVVDFKVVQANSYARAMSNMRTINHGVDLSTFYPVSKERKLELRESFGIPSTDFVFVYFGRNSPRKQQPITLQAFKEVLEKYPNCTLIMGCKIKDAGWDLAEVVRNIGLNPTKVLFTDNSSSEYAEGLTTEQIADVYRVSDCFVSSAVGGGFELCHLESAACGLPQIGVDGAGSITDMVKGKGLLVPAKKYWLGGQHGPFERPLATPRDFAKAMKEMVTSTNKSRWASAAIDFSKKEEYSWDFATKEFEKVIDIAMADESVAVKGMYDV